MAITEENKQVQDISFPETRKERFRIDGDNNRIVELNTSDMGIVKRIGKIMPKLNKLANVATLMVPEDATEEEGMNMIGDKIAEIDMQMRSLINELFDSEVDVACAPDGTMFDMFNGRFRFELIIERLGKLYGDNFEREIGKVNKRIDKHTNKYTN